MDLLKNFSQISLIIPTKDQNAILIPIGSPNGDIGFITKSFTSILPQRYGNLDRIILELENFSLPNSWLVNIGVKNDKNIIFKAVVVAVLDEEAWAVLNNGQHEISETLAILLGAIPILK